ncbi:MAG: hypothetical protein RL701_3860 [Pseudomonadota bacterium]
MRERLTYVPSDAGETDALKTRTDATDVLPPFLAGTRAEYPRTSRGRLTEVPAKQTPCFAAISALCGVWRGGLRC